jgi:hypothetical protein
MKLLNEPWSWKNFLNKRPMQWNTDISLAFGILVVCTEQDP